MTINVTSSPLKRKAVWGAKRWSVALGLVAALVSPALAAPKGGGRGGPHAKLDNELLKATSGPADATQKVIISVNPGCQDAAVASLQRHGAKLKARHQSIAAVSAQVKAADLADFEADDCVRSVSLDAPVRAHGVTAAVSPQLRQTLGLSMPVGRGSLTAGDVGVAIIDSGIAPLSDFGGRIWAFYDFTSGTGVATAPSDGYGHGTHIAGLIGGSGKGSSNQFQGIAPNVGLVGLKVLDSNGQGDTSDVIAALEWVTQHHNEDAYWIQVVNLSLGHPIYEPAATDPLVQAVEACVRAGVTVVVAAGNNGWNADTQQSGYGGINSPGNAPDAITVGAVDTKNTATRDDDVVAPYSSRGPTWFDAYAKPDIVAPGHKLVSDASTSMTLYKNLGSSQNAASNGAPMLSLSGTSMAAAVASGTAALVLEARYKTFGWHDWDLDIGSSPLPPNTVKAILEYTAIPLVGADPLTQGAGELNAAGAITLTQAIDPSVDVGQWWLVTGITPSSTLGNQGYSWGQQVLWGDTILGGDVMYSNNIVWGTNIVWATSTDLEALPEPAVVAPPPSWPSTDKPL